MPILLLLSDAPSLAEELARLSSDIQPQLGPFMPCSSVEQGLEFLEALSESPVWLIDSRTSLGEDIPNSHPKLLLRLNEIQPPPGMPCLYPPFRAEELASSLHDLHASPGSSSSSLTQEELDTFIHDLNNCLATVSGYISLLPELMPQEAEMIQEMEEAMTRAEKLIEQHQNHFLRSNHQN